MLITRSTIAVSARYRISISHCRNSGPYRLPGRADHRKSIMVVAVVVIIERDCVVRAIPKPVQRDNPRPIAAVAVSCFICLRSAAIASCRDQRVYSTPTIEA